MKTCEWRPQTKSLTAAWSSKKATEPCLIVGVLNCNFIVLLYRCNEIVYQLLFDFRQGLWENLKKAQGVRVGRKVRTTWLRSGCCKCCLYWCVEDSFLGCVFCKSRVAVPCWQILTLRSFQLVMCPCKSKAAGVDSHACQQVHRWDRVQALLEAEAIGAEAIDEIAASASLAKTVTWI